MFRIGPIAHAAERVQRLLLDHKRCEMVTITLPEELPVNETLELLRKARQMGIAARMVVVNQVPAMLLHASDRPLLEILQRESEEALARLALAAQGQLDGLDHARKQIERLRGLESASVVEFPARPRPTHLKTSDLRARPRPLLATPLNWPRSSPMRRWWCAWDQAAWARPPFRRCWPCARPQPGGAPWC